MTPRGRAARALNLAATHYHTAVLGWCKSRDECRDDLDRRRFLQLRREAVTFAREWVEEAARVRQEQRRDGFRVVEVVAQMFRGTVEVPGAVLVNVHGMIGWAVE